MSLIESLVVVALLAVVIGLLLGAIQKVRERASAARVLNTTRQVTLALHSYAIAKGGRLPNVDGGPPNTGYAPLMAIGGDLGQTPEQVELTLTSPLLRAYGADPSAQPGAMPTGIRASASEEEFDRVHSLVSVSYALNAGLFHPGAWLERSIPDGLSNTMAVVTHYANCGPTKFHAGTVATTSHDDDGKLVPVVNPSIHRATFADPMTDDDKPVTARTFQHRPAVAVSDYRVPQSLTAGGLTVGFADGSARTVRPDVSPAVFWGAVTPNGGEVLAWDD